MSLTRLIKIDNYKKLVNELPEINQPFNLMEFQNFEKKFLQAEIVRLDIHRVKVMDYLLKRFYEMYVKIDDWLYTDVLYQISHCLAIAREMQDYPIVIYLGIQLATSLQAIEQSQGAYLTLEFVRDICEDTYNFPPLLDVYFRMGIILKKMGEYDKALTVTKKLL